ncbi:hypothetical protein [Effusibacillus consociatus]|uniref:DUF4352 domain-containing protein n=1 Tax=Effusibacillus consociatus TaxID=1117041 RepID=A0ABV9Q8K8_9BACL
MQWPWGNGWVLLLLTVVVLVVLVACTPAVKEKKEQKEYVVTVEGTIMKVLEDDTDTKGGKHQRLFVRVNKVLDNPEDVRIERKEDIFVAIRYGDKDGFPQRLKELDKGEGKRIEIRGRYIPKEQAVGNEKKSVLHFTHKPVGYIRFDNKTHR